MKYLTAFFVPYGSFLETNTYQHQHHLSGMLFCFCKMHFFYFFVVKTYVLSTHSYMH